MATLTTLSGFPEWLPEDKLVEQLFLDSIRKNFELYGFTPLETRAVEPLDQLLVKGETDHEIYLLRRLQADEDEPDLDIGLHFDLTVPFARYVSENHGRLVFPFRRYQMQKSWRGERPGLGRFREFLQADFDIISDQEMTIQSDIEILKVLVDILHTLPIPPAQVIINHRRILEGFYKALGVTDHLSVIRIVDKLAKIGAQAVQQQLSEETSLSEQAIQKCLDLAEIQTNVMEVLIERVSALGIEHPVLEEGLKELATLLDALRDTPQGVVVADLSLARGLDYYTGMVVEARFSQLPHYPSIAGGGRYDHLASSGGSRPLPGVGVTIGISRILGVVLHEGVFQASRSTPSCALVALVSDERRADSLRIAQALRQRDIACEIYERPDRYGKQIRYAEKKGIPFVWFPAQDQGSQDEVKDIRSGVQVAADPAGWEPPEADRSVRILRNEQAWQDLLQNPLYQGEAA